MVVFSDPGAVPENWRPMLEEDSLGTASPTALSGYIIPESRDLPSSTSEDLERRQTMRFCTRCQNGKPPRCHHCSVCKLVLYADLDFLLHFLGFSLNSQLSCSFCPHKYCLALVEILLRCCLSRTV